EELAGRPTVTRDDHHGPVPGELAKVGEHVRSCNRQVKGELNGQVTVRQAADTVGAEQSAHGYRLLYWGALQAFFRPYFLRSVTQAARVRKPAFLSVSRLPSTSISLSAQATPSRRTPACPLTPPPPMRTMTS